MQGLDEHMQQLLIRYLDNEATDSEIATVKEWLNEPTNQTYFDGLKELHGKVKNTQYATPANVDVDAAWQKVEGRTIIKNKPQLEVVKPTINTFLWLKIAAVLVIGFSIFWWFSNNAVNPPETIAYKTMKANDSSLLVSLPDGSRVTLNANSSLTYPETFDGNLRNVSLNGEAFFDISRDTSKPFTIDAGDANIRVLGTSFLVQNIKDSGVVVSVATGKVRLTKKGNEANVELVKGEQGFLAKTEIQPTKQPIENINYLAVYNRVLRFENTPLNIVIKDLENYFKVKFDVEESTIEGCRITAKFEESSLKEILTTLKIYFSWEIQENNNTIIIKGKGCR